MPFEQGDDWISPKFLLIFDMVLESPGVGREKHVEACSNVYSEYSGDSSSNKGQDKQKNDEGVLLDEEGYFLSYTLHDFYPPGGGSIWYYQDTANDRFIVEFYQVPLLSGGGSYTFEAIFYPDGTIDYMYNDLTPGTPNSCTVGVENATGTVGVQCTYNGSGPLEPAPLTGIRIYPVWAPVVPDVTITLVPTSATSFPSSTGGTLMFDVEVSNNEATSQFGNLWTQYSDRVLLGPSPTLEFLPGLSTYTGIRQLIPGDGRLPPGMYDYDGYVGVPPTVWDMYTLPIEITADDGMGGSGLSDWEVRSDFFGKDTPDIGIATPDAFALIGVSPNPFNPDVAISFALPEAAKVTLTVYDISGRTVARLVDGWRDAGVHEAVFDGSNLASGVYIYNLNAGQFNATGKMIMMK